jgi:hypothetical protein
MDTNIGSLMLQGKESTQGNQSLKNVIEKLIQELTQKGSLDESSPLGKMLANHMQEKGIQNTGPDSLKEGLESLISDKLGPNFGAAESFGLGGGQQDLMSKVLNGLAKSSLDDLLTKQGEGTQFSQSDMPMLEKIAEFMDKFPKDFPPPDSGSWKNELKEDNYLSGSETEAFRAALDKLGGQLDANAAGGAQGQPQEGLGAAQGLGSPNSQGNSNSVSPSSNSVQDLETLLMDLIKKGIQATLAGNTGSTSNSPGNGQQTLDSSAAQTAESLITALLQGGGGQTSPLS